jgi:pimeloyl-ACP methyl ester carboxylesterase
MPYANNNGVRIHYEVEGKGSSLIMAHGVTRSLERWREIGFADALRNDYRLLMFDARGHGMSDKPHDPSAYGANMVGDVLAVLDDAGVRVANYMGYSMGAGVGFACAVRYPVRFRSFILGGWNPYRTQQTATNAPANDVPGQVSLLRTDPQAFLRQREQQLGRSMTPEERQAELANDPEALGALLATFRDVATASNEELERIHVPCLLYAGDADPFHTGAREASRHVKEARFFSLPGLNHVQAGASLLALPHVKEFLVQLSKK